MKVYEQNQIRNVALIGAPGSGKTTLAETMLFESGIVKRRGSVDEKSTVSDFHEVEQERGNSVYASFMHAEWRDCKINILDTPGLDDFVGEVFSSMRVADNAILVLSGQHGMEVGTEILWSKVGEMKKPTMIVINGMDHPKANFEGALESVKKRFGSNAILVQYPFNQGEHFNSIIDVFKMTMYQFPAGGGKPQKLAIPASEKERVEKLRGELIEKAAENDESLMEKYFESGTLEESELARGMKLGFAKQDLMPIYCVSAKANMGSGRVMGFLNSVALAPHEAAPETTIDEKELKFDPKGPSVVFIYKTLMEQYLGKVNFFKVCSGEIKTGMEFANSVTGDSEKIGQILIMDGKNRNIVDRMVAGDIGALVKLKNTSTNQTLHTKESDLVIKPIEFPTAKIQLAIAAENKNDDEKMVTGLREFHEEDPTFLFEYSKELKQLIVSGQGELHLDIARWRLQHSFSVKSTFLRPRIPYRETIQKDADSMYRHKKQSGGAGQFGEVHIKVLPYKEGMPKPEGFSIRKEEIIDLPWGGKLVFYNAIVGGVIDARFVPSVLKGILEKMEEGPITGSYARDVCVVLHDGKMHPVDSNDISFKIAGSMSFKDGFLQASPLLLEPIYELSVTVPEELVGDVMADLQSRRSVIQGIDSVNNYQVVKAKAPLSELYKYSTSLKSITQGRAGFSCKFSEYVTVPGELQKKLAQEYAAAKAN
ncbi:MAG: elongation factor G [Oligoflexia bacterium]|nr:elongation factor G [Oligoflexia bacterium]MBF0365723.1 elongation factor G [Oligoflexia bacterium]